MTEKKLSLHALFRNNRFLMLLSFVIAFFIWAGVTMKMSPVETRDIDVAVQIDLDSANLKQANLTLFGNRDFKVKLKVSGKRYLLNSLSAEDFVVAAPTNTITAAGKYTLQLTQKFLNEKNAQEFSIVSLSQNSVDVFFDVYKEQDFQISAQIVAPDNKIVPDGYLYDDPIFSVATVTLAGPQSEIGKVTKVFGHLDLSAQLTTSINQAVSIQFETQNNAAVPNVSVKDGESVTMSITVLKQATLPVGVNFINAPADYRETPLAYTSTPSSVTVAAPEDAINGLTALMVGTVNFNDIGKTAQTFTFQASDLSGFRILDTKVTEFRITIPANNRNSRQITIPAANITTPANTPGGFLAQVMITPITGVTLIGSRDALAAVQEASVYADVDLSKLPAAAGEYTVSVKIRIQGNSSCWANGTYQVRVLLSPIS